MESLEGISSALCRALENLRSVPDVNDSSVHKACRTVVVFYTSVCPRHLAECTLWDAQRVFIVGNMVLLKDFQLEANRLSISLGKI